MKDPKPMMASSHIRNKDNFRNKMWSKRSFCIHTNKSNWFSDFTKTKKILSIIANESRLLTMRKNKTKKSKNALSNLCWLDLYTNGPLRAPIFSLKRKELSTWKIPRIPKRNLWKGNWIEIMKDSNEVHQGSMDSKRQWNDWKMDTVSQS
jgi:hypothetical protein